MQRLNALLISGRSALSSAALLRPPRAPFALHRSRAAFLARQSGVIAPQKSTAAAGCATATMVTSAAPLAAAAGAGTTWQAEGSQEDFMKRDECILVDGADNIIGHANKYDSHRFVEGQPEGRLHRAFSVFLFNSRNELLLQQRAASKITFPGVWTNTCCSHQLYGQSPDEVDTPAAIADGRVPGAKRAAVRKLLHELGIPPEQLPIEGFRYLTRLHYCAADTDTHGPQSPWGEHEMDYILFVKADVTVTPHPDEVSDYKYVTLPQLRSMMAPDSGLSWSPWFRLIAANLLEAWWQNVDETIATDKHVDLKTIHKLTC